MKKTILLLLSVVALNLYARAQTYRIVPGQANINYLPSKTGGNSLEVRDVKVSVEFWGAQPSNDVSLTFSIANPSNASLGATLVNAPVGGYVISKEDFNATKYDSVEFILHVSINAVTNMTSSETFQIQLSGANAPVFLVVVDPTTTPKTEKQSADRYRLMFLNALNFDFSSSLTSNYVGSLNFFVPPVSKSRWGYNVGFTKISYSGTDSNNMRYRTENILINPLDSLKAGSKYLKQINKYTTVTQNTVWSIFAQPLFRLTPREHANQIYAHVHGELLVNKWYVKTTIANVQQDTLTFQSPAPGFVAHAQLDKTNNYSRTLLNGYFGVGLTFDLQPWKNASFFFQTTVGKTTNYPQPAAMDISTNFSTGFVGIRSNDEWSNFYLVRAYLNQKVSDSATIVVGTDIRGLFPRYNPQYAIYLGLNLQVEGILGLLGIKKS